MSDSLQPLRNKLQMATRSEYTLTSNELRDIFKSFSLKDYQAVIVDAYAMAPDEFTIDDDTIGSRITEAMESIGDIPSPDPSVKVYSLLCQCGHVGHNHPCYQCDCTEFKNMDDLQYEDDVDYACQCGHYHYGRKHTAEGCTLCDCTEYIVTSEKVYSQCECTDTACLVHAGHPCPYGGNTTLYRVDMVDATGTNFCDACADDAMTSGLFDTVSNFYSKDGNDTECSICGGLGVYMGTLGQVTWYRCEACNWEFREYSR